VIHPSRTVLENSVTACRVMREIETSCCSARRTSSACLSSRRFTVTLVAFVVLKTPLPLQAKYLLQNAANCSIDQQFFDSFPWRDGYDIPSEPTLSELRASGVEVTSERPQGAERLEDGGAVDGVSTHLGSRSDQRECFSIDQALNLRCINVYTYSRILV